MRAESVPPDAQVQSHLDGPPRARCSTRLPSAEPGYPAKTTAGSEKHRFSAEKRAPVSYSSSEHPPPPHDAYGRYFKPIHIFYSLHLPPKNRLLSPGDDPTGVLGFLSTWRLSHPDGFSGLSPPRTSIEESPGTMQGVKRAKPLLTKVL